MIICYKDLILELLRIRREMFFTVVQPNGWRKVFCSLNPEWGVGFTIVGIKPFHKLLIHKGNFLQNWKVSFNRVEITRRKSSCKLWVTLIHLDISVSPWSSTIPNMLGINELKILILDAPNRVNWRFSRKCFGIHLSKTGVASRGYWFPKCHVNSSSQTKALPALSKANGFF